MGYRNLPRIWELFLAGVNLSYTKKTLPTNKSLSVSLKAVAIPVTGGCKADQCLCCIFHLVMPTVCVPKQVCV